MPEAAKFLPAMPAERIRAVPLVWWRRLSQLAATAMIGQWSFYGIFRCPFIVPYVSCQNCPVITCHGRLFTLFWGVWLLLPLSALIFGRAFCAWACPGGLVNQLLGRLAPFKWRARTIFTRLSPYMLLLSAAAALYILLLQGQPREVVPIRIGGFSESIRLTFEHANRLWLVRTFVVLGLLAMGVLLANAWCRFFCPSGGVLEWLKHLSWLKIYKTERCNDCDQCLKVCEMGTRPSEAGCTNCGDCLSACQRGAIRVGRYGGR